MDQKKETTFDINGYGAEKFRIAAVDDDEMCLKNITAMLNGIDMRVNCMRSGHSLLKYLEHNSPDLILLDIMMPDMDGFAAFKALRELEENKGRSRTPVIFLSGDNDNVTEQRGLELGADDFVRKPIDCDILLRRIRNAVMNSRKIVTLTEEAVIDKLTGFLNKAAGMEKLSGICGTKTGALMLMDLDSFKLVNDLYGHEIGDRVLAAFSEIVRKNIRSDDTVCRIGGDEFLAFFSEITTENAVASISMRLNDQFIRECKAIMGENMDIPIGISIGAAFAPEHSADYDELFGYADKAMYQVKQNGKHGYNVFRLSDGPVSEYDLEKEIARVTQIVEERGIGNGAMLLGQDSFSWNYRFIVRFIKRYKEDATKLLFSLSSKSKDGDIKAFTEEFAEILQRTLRRSDIIFQSRPNQFFIVLPELSEQDVKSVLERIYKELTAAEYYDDMIVKHTYQTLSFKDQAADSG